MADSNCIFCKIVAGEIPADIVHRDETCTAFRDRTPAAPTHVLVVPNKHIVSLNELQDADAGSIGRLFVVAAAIAKDQKIDASGYRVVVNTGQEGGQSVFHLHVHLLGGRPMQWPPG
jgi:histidine triad (HIT) family protein